MSTATPNQEDSMEINASDRAKLETPVSYTHAVTKARRIVGPRSGKELLKSGVIAQDDEHDGGNGKWYVFPFHPDVQAALAPTDAELGRCPHGALMGFCIHEDCNTSGADERQEDNSMAKGSKTKTRSTAKTATRKSTTQATRKPGEAEMQQVAEAADVKSLQAELMQRIKTSIRGAKLRPAPSGAYTSVIVGKTAVAYLNPRKKALVIHLRLTGWEDGTPPIELTEYAGSQKDVKRQAKVTSPEQIEGALTVIETAAAKAAA